LYEKYFKQLLNTFFYPSGALRDVAVALNSMSNVAAQQDYWHHLQYSWSYEEYETNYETPIVRYGTWTDGIQTFIEERWKSAWYQLDSAN
jgi:hypothetical protein